MTVRLGRGRRARELLVATFLSAACGGHSARQGITGDGDDDSGGGGRGGATSTGGACSDATGGAGVAGSGATSGMAGYGSVECPVDSPTRISGVVHDPAGRVALYNALVLVPGVSAPPPESGVTCGRCEELAALEPLAAALSDEHGGFSIPSAPAGVNVPLLVEAGGFRRELVVPTVRACEDNVLDAELTRLPRSRVEGHVPFIAVTTGADDSLECFLRRIGVADEEFSTPSGPGRVHLYTGCDAGLGLGTRAFDGSDELFPAAEALFGAPATLARYRMIFLGCEGGPCAEEKAPLAENLAAYADAGGWLFFGHQQSVWFSLARAWPGVAHSAVQVGASLFTSQVDVSFPKGAVFADWLVAVGASSVHGELPIADASLSLAADSTELSRFLYAPLEPESLSQAFIMKTPFLAPPDMACGRVTAFDFHVSSSASPDRRPEPFPSGCVEGELSPQEKALEFLMFDRAGCFSGPAPPRPPCAPL